MNFEPETITFAAEKLTRRGKARFRAKDGSEGFVEEVALREFLNEGWDGLWSENRTWWALMALLFWDVLFARLDGVWDPNMGEFPSRWQDMPNDLFRPEFFSRRSELVENRLAQLRNTELLEEVRRSYSIHQGTPCRVIEDWASCRLDSLLSVARHAPPRLVLGVSRRLLEDFNENRRGLPDLTIWRTGEFGVVEVKGPGDRLSPEQRAWLRVFSEFGTTTKVALVKATGRQKPEGAKSRESSEVLAASRQRLRKATRAMPYPGAFREAALALRAMIRVHRKAKDDYEQLVADLYRVAAQENFLMATPYYEDIGSGFSVAENTPKEVWTSLDMPYQEIGYEELSLLNKTDRKWLVELWGEPVHHQSAQRYHSSVWQRCLDDYRSKVEAGREELDEEMRRLLANDGDSDLSRPAPDQETSPSKSSPAGVIRTVIIAIIFLWVLSILLF